jgi:hypothetical protein
MPQTLPVQATWPGSTVNGDADPTSAKLASRAQFVRELQEINNVISDIFTVSKL